jgi:adenosylcobinamide kinase/adenosylcobinamide-phosphate guanylyltransferase
MESEAMIAFVSGGARSGKTGAAEYFSLKISEMTESPLYYLATALSTDEEMMDRIHRHQKERENRWVTIEEPYYLHERLKRLPRHSVILIDCLTIWLSHVIFFEQWSEARILNEVKHSLATAAKHELSLIFVSNDVNEGVPIHHQEVSRYIRILEHIHRLIVERSDQAVQVVSGIPIVWKGDDVI